MTEVISLDEARALRRKPGAVPTFDRVMDRLFEALDLIDAQRTDEAHRAVCEACEMLLTREERVIAWTTR